MSSSLPQYIGLYGYVFTFPLGFIGHTCSLLTFLSKTLRVTSTGFLFICLTFSDILYQLMSINDFIKQNLQIPTPKNEYICRLRTFILNFSTFTSAWILVLISLDRLIRTYLPHQQRRLCTRKVACLAVGVVCICSIMFTSHVLQSDFNYSNPIRNICGPDSSMVTVYSIFYSTIWPSLQLTITYVIPAGLMLVSLICIRIKLNQQLVLRTNRRERLQQQMFILMISSTLCFSLSTIPYSIHRVYYQRYGLNSTTLTEIAILTIILNMNYCYNFYIHCLTSNLFREKFIQQIKKIYQCCKKQNNNRIHPNTITNTVQH